MKPSEKKRRIRISRTMRAYFALHPRPKSPKKSKHDCECGCRTQVWNRFARGHQSYNPQIQARRVKKIKKLWLDDGFRRSRVTEIRKRTRSIQHREALRKATTERWKDPTYRAFIAENTGYSSCKRGHVQTKRNGEVYYRSSWEEAFIELLDTSPLVRRFIPQPFGISYLFEGKKYNYYPDYFIEFRDGRKFVLEIKGYEDERTRFKYMAAFRYCVENEYEWAVISEKPNRSLEHYIQ